MTSPTGPISRVSQSAVNNPRQYERAVEEMERVEGVIRRRLYYRGEQYDYENECALLLLNQGKTADKLTRLPEHLRKHAYSTQIEESIDYLVNRIGAGFAVTSKAPDVQSVLDALTESTDALNAVDEDGNDVMVTDEPLREALVAGDCPVLVRFDDAEQVPWLEFWDSDQVEFEQDSTHLTNSDRVIRRQMVWREDGAGELREVEERAVYSMRVNVAGEWEAHLAIFYEQDEEPDRERWLGIGRIPWCLLRGSTRGLRLVRGKSLITRQSEQAADRYNANEQTAWKIARYNSHGNLVVVGDNAETKLAEGGKISKDVADVLTFPENSKPIAITLPTDPSMIEHQKQVLTDALYATFGLTRMDNDSLTKAGQVSGYALEILNQKSDGTFKGITRNWRKDWKGLVNLVLDVVAWRESAKTVVLDLTTGEMQEVDLSSDDAIDQIPAAALDPDDEAMEIVDRWWEVDPDVRFPNRQLTITMGTGHVVDEVRIRDDYTSGLISQQEALRQRGLDAKDIARILREQKAEKPVTESTTFGGSTGGRVPSARAGSTVADSSAVDGLPDNTGD